MSLQLSTSYKYTIQNKYQIKKLTITFKLRRVFLNLGETLCFVSTDKSGSSVDLLRCRVLEDTLSIK